MWWTFRDTRWAEMWLSLRAANYLVLVPYALLLLVIHLARTLRWGNLLSGMAPASFRAVNEASSIGFMMLIILPFRLGEFARPFLIAQRTQIRRSAAMATVVFERVVDGIVIAVLLRVLMFFIEGESSDIDYIRIGANVMFLVFFSGLVLLLAARWQHDRVIALLRATAGRVAPGITEKVVNIVDGFVGALKQLPNAKNVALFSFWTAVYWLANGYGMSLVANAFDCSGTTAAGCEPIHLSVFQGFVLLSVLIIGMMIPAAPGSAGTFQAFILLAMRVFLPDTVVNSSGIAFANVIWIVQLAQQILFGITFMVLSHGSFREITERLQEEEKQTASAETTAV
jgi:uncharacterized protein (TIRG00374 family)